MARDLHLPPGAVGDGAHLRGEHSGREEPTEKGDSGADPKKHALL
jgi:hypothetical protein